MFRLSLACPGNMKSHVFYDTSELIPGVDVRQPDRLVACHLDEANAAAA